MKRITKLFWRNILVALAGITIAGLVITGIYRLCVLVGNPLPFFGIFFAVIISAACWSIAESEIEIEQKAAATDVPEGEGPTSCCRPATCGPEETQPVHELGSVQVQYDRVPNGQPRGTTVPGDHP